MTTEPERLLHACDSRSERRHLNRVVACSLLAAISVLVSLAVSAKQSGPAAAPLEWVECPIIVGKRIRCGTLSIPENWKRPPSPRRIKISFMVIAAGEAINKAPDPIAFLSPGPSFSAFGMLPSVLPMPLGRKRDIILMESRGNGYADPALVCASVAELAECYQNAISEGVDPNQYNTEASIHDLEALRLALGIDHWNVFGVSYGTYWASHYARLYPDAIRSLILDSPYPPHAGYEWSRPSALNAFNRMFNDCRANTLCNAAYPDLRARFIRMLRRVAAEPVRLSNKTLGVHDVFDLIYKTIYLSTSMHRTPILIDAADKEDFGLFLKIGRVLPFALPQGFNPSHMRSLGANASILCAEDIFFPAAPETRIALTAPWPEDIVQLITPEGWDYDQRCTAWPVKKANPVMNAAVTTDIPAIVLVGAYDPITPPDFAEAMLLTMSRGTMVLDTSAAHALFSDDNPCVHDIMMRFIDAPEKDLDVSCLVETPPAQWLLPHEWPRNKN